MQHSTESQQTATETVTESQETATAPVVPALDPMIATRADWARFGFVASDLREYWTVPGWDSAPRTGVVIGAGSDYDYYLWRNVADVLRDDALCKESKWESGAAIRAVYDTYGFANLLQVEIPTKTQTKLHKRVSGYLYKTYGKSVTLSPGAVESISNMARDYEPKTLSVALTDRMNWVEGGFGDSGSCFFKWSWHNAARVLTLPQLGALALLSFRSDQIAGAIADHSARLWETDNTAPRYRTGDGRAWLYPVPHSTAPDFPAFVVSNGYGAYSPDRINRAGSGHLGRATARVLETYTGIQWETGDYPISTYFEGLDSYSNGDSYLLTPAGLRHRLYSSSIRFSAGSVVCETPAWSFVDNNALDPHNRPYNLDSYGQSECARCAEMYPEGQLDGRGLCHDCRDYVTTCDACGDWHDDDDSVSVDGHGDYCPHCAGIYLRYSDVMSEYLHRDDAVDVPGLGYMTAEYRDENYVQCVVCGLYQWDGDTYTVNDARGEDFQVCDSCYSEHTAESRDHENRVIVAETVANDDVVSATLSTVLRYVTETLTDVRHRLSLYKVSGDGLRAHEYNWRDQYYVNTDYVTTLDRARCAVEWLSELDNRVTQHSATQETIAIGVDFVTCYNTAPRTGVTFWESLSATVSVFSNWTVALTVALHGDRDHTCAMPTQETIETALQTA